MEQMLKLCEKYNFEGEFPYAVTEVIKREGGFSNNKFDKGGKTKYGISKRFVKENEKVLKKCGILDVDDIDEFVESLTLEQAVLIYYRLFWRPLRCEEMNGIVSTYLFDTAVNSGIYRAVKLLQSSVNAVSEESLVVDGIIGNRTISAVNNIPIIPRLLLEFVSQRVKFYVSIGLKGNNKVFLKGWVNRALSYNHLINV